MSSSGLRQKDLYQFLSSESLSLPSNWSIFDFFFDPLCYAVHLCSWNHVRHSFFFSNNSNLFTGTILQRSKISKRPFKYFRGQIVHHLMKRLIWLYLCAIGVPHYSQSSELRPAPPGIFPAPSSNPTHWITLSLFKLLTKMCSRLLRLDYLFFTHYHIFNTTPTCRKIVTVDWCYTIFYYLIKV